MNESDIPWTEYTWNPVHGCSKVSAGCKNCYAEKISRRFNHTESEWTHENAAENVQMQKHKLNEPRHEEDGGYIFVNSMGDLFHEEASDKYIRRVFDVMNEADHHTYQILTKRPERAAEWEYGWDDHIWLGTSVESHRVKKRVTHLKMSDAATKFISFEPLIDVATANFLEIDWVIVGGESAPDDARRDMKDEWVRELHEQVAASEGTAWFFKQDSGRYPDRIEDPSAEYAYREMPDGREPPETVDETVARTRGGEDNTDDSQTKLSEVEE